MSVKLSKHPSFSQYLIAECTASSEETARALVEATARWANCEILHESHRSPRAYAEAHTWFLAPLASNGVAEQTHAMAV